MSRSRVSATCQATALLRDPFVVVAQQGHPVAAVPMSLEAYAAQNHVLVSPRGFVIHGSGTQSGLSMTARPVVCEEPRPYDDGVGGLMTNLSRRFILIGLPTLVAVGGAAAEKRVALKGYDPVSYFTAGRPEQGSAEYQAAFDDATYWFKNADHRAMFVADPDHYAPQFRGYCTVTLSHGSKLEADPEAWTIADGKLYVFGAKQAVPMFEAQTASIVEKASDNWGKLRNAP